MLSACNDESRKPEPKDRDLTKVTNLQNTFTKPIVKISLAGGNKHNVFGVKNCHVFKAIQTQGTIYDWELIFKPAPYILPKMCIRERLEMEGRYLHIEIGTQAMGAGGCCTTYAAYRSLDGETWEIRPATSVKTWQPLEMVEKERE